jgi:hypothetical protein
MITDSQRIVARSCCLVIPTARMTPSSRVRSKIDSASVLPMPSRLAPKRRPVPIQLWDLRRAGITAGLIASLAAVVAVLYAFVKMAGLL